MQHTKAHYALRKKIKKILQSPLKWSFFRLSKDYLKSSTNTMTITRVNKADLATRRIIKQGEREIGTSHYR